ncbi:MAG: FtsX-like permease family protein [Candidatus Moraniibacteriota bacterium]
MSHYLSRLGILLSFVLRDVSKSRFVLIFTTISLSTAFTAVFLSAGILEGFQVMLKSGAIDTMGEIVIYPKDGETHIENIESISQEIKDTENVESFSVRDVGEAIIEYGDTKIGPYATMGMEVAREASVTKLPEDITEGRFLNNKDSKNVVLGATLADALVGLQYDGRRVPIGGKVKISSGTGQQGEYTVVGILDGKTFAPNWVVYFNKDELDKFEPRYKDNQIVVKLKDPTQPAITKQILRQKKLDMQVVTWQDEAGFIANIVSATKFVTGSISGLLIIAVFVIMSVIIFINVSQRRRQIGILKSMGASNRFIVAIYVFEAFTYATISFAFGLLFFMLIHIHSTSNPMHTLIGDFHTEFNPQDIVPSLIVLVLASMGGSFFPALSAARTRIADVVRSGV